MSARLTKILLVDDDDSLRRVVSYQLTQMGFEVTASADGAEALMVFKKDLFDVALIDLQLPGLSGMELLTEIRRLNKEVIIIIITAYGTVDNAVEACRLGADDYLTKPFGKEMLRFAIEKSLRLRQLQAENIQLRGELLEKYDFGNLVAKSAALEEVLKLSGRVAESEATVLIQGETGTGKELLARAIHYNSPRKNKPFITVNCPSIPENLLESELFGHVKGAFTGALRDRKGKFELADTGTIFLDEIGDLKEELQAKLLRTLQEKEIERVGDSRPIKLDVRVIAATNKDLTQLMASGQFREDLYYRLSVVPIMVPPLRDHKEDIPFLVDHFLKKYGKGQTYRVADNVWEALMGYHWPGNVRELENAVERAIILSPSPVLSLEVFPASLKKIAPAGLQVPTDAGQTTALENLSLEEVERRAILNALEKSRGNQTQAAKMLKIPRHVLLYRMKKFGLHSKL